jgi:hypothetical protein
MINFKRLATPGMFVLGALLYSWLPVANALPDGQQLIKYFNPIHEKSYLNEKQDRLIKKKAFKESEIAGIHPIANKDIGLFAIVPLEQLQDANYINHLLSEEQINGLSCTLPWKIIQPQEDKFDWQILDNLLSDCTKHDKQLIFRVSTCGSERQGMMHDATCDTPDWVFQAGAKSIGYKDKDGKEHKMPIFWDGTYLAKWSNFINELGKRYDKHAGIQSVGITGGGILGGTNVIPDFAGNKEALAEFTEQLKKTFGMSPRQLVGHWKYVADIFPRAFQAQHLNFDLDPPTNDRKGQDCLDEIADYIVYRYGERVYLTRQNVKDDKHGFDQYRLLLKYKNDTLTGYQTTPALFVENEKSALDESLSKVAKAAFDDDLSFMEIPAATFENNNTAIKDWLYKMRLHLGYELILTEFNLPQNLPVGKPLPVQFTFINNGAASPKRPMREMDKEVPTSYKIQIAIKNSEGKTLALIRHTPSESTVDWIGNKPIQWEEQLKMPALKPGKYNLFVSIIDEKIGSKLNFTDTATAKEPKTGNDLQVGSIEISK